MLLDYILTLMGRDDEDGISDSNLDLLNTQVFLGVLFCFKYLLEPGDLSVLY